MSTVGDLIDRVYRAYLTPPDNQQVSTLLAGDITADAKTFTYSGFQLPEAEAMLDVGTIVEIGSELMRLDAAVDTSARSGTFVRHVLGTEAAAHSEGDQLFVSPTFTRKSVFDAVADAIVGLYPDLYGVATKALVAANVMDLADVDAVNVIDARYLYGSQWESTQLQLVKGFPEVQTGPALLRDDPTVEGLIYVTYGHRFPQLTAESDDLDDIDLEAAWEGIVALTAAQTVIGGQPLEYLNTEYITEALKAQGLAAADFSSITTAMLRLRALLVRNAARDLRSRYDPEVYITQVI